MAGTSGGVGLYGLRLLALQVLVHPPSETAGPVGRREGSPGLGDEVLAEIDQGFADIGVGSQASLPAGALPHGQVRLPVERHGLLALTVGGEGRYQVGRIAQRLAVVGLLSSSLEDIRLAFARVRERGG
jgi:hypothetical protein